MDSAKRPESDCFFDPPANIGGKLTIFTVPHGGQKMSGTNRCNTTPQRKALAGVRGTPRRFCILLPFKRMCPRGMSAPAAGKPGGIAARKKHPEATAR